MKGKNQLVLKLVVFTVKENLRVFWKKEKLPEVIIESGKVLDEIALSLFEKTFGLFLGQNYQEQLYTFSQTGGRIVVSYFILIPEFQIPEKVKIFFLPVEKISKKSLDYPIVSYALQRLRWKIEYTNAVYSLLPEEFTFSELQRVYEAILGKVLDKRNFRKKMLSLGILKKTGHIKKLNRARPAEMWTFRERKLTYVRIL